MLNTISNLKNKHLKVLSSRVLTTIPAAAIRPGRARRAKIVKRKSANAERKKTSSAANNSTVASATHGNS